MLSGAAAAAKAIGTMRREKLMARSLQEYPSLITAQEPAKL